MAASPSTALTHTNAHAPIIAQILDASLIGYGSVFSHPGFLARYTVGGAATGLTLGYFVARRIVANADQEPKTQMAASTPNGSAKETTNDADADAVISHAVASVAASGAIAGAILGLGLAYKLQCWSSAAAWHAENLLLLVDFQTRARALHLQFLRRYAATETLGAAAVFRAPRLTPLPLLAHRR